MKRGDIYLVTLDPTEGREQQGYRPVLVISPQAFNEATKLPVILPITAGGEFTSFPRRSVGTRKRTPTFVSARPHCAAPLQTTPSKRNEQEKRGQDQARETHRETGSPRSHAPAWECPVVAV